MNEMMQKLMASKPSMSDSESDAHLAVLKDLKSKLGGDKIKGLQKVTVASSSPEGLKAGLSKAEDIVQKPGVENSMPDDIMPQDEEMDHKSMILAKANEMSADELDACIQELMELKAQKEDSSEDSESEEDKEV